MSQDRCDAILSDGFNFCHWAVIQDQWHRHSFNTILLLINVSVKEKKRYLCSQNCQPHLILSLLLFEESTLDSVYSSTVYKFLKCIYSQFVWQGTRVTGYTGNTDLCLQLPLGDKVFWIWKLFVLDLFIYSSVTQCRLLSLPYFNVYLHHMGPPSLKLADSAFSFCVVGLAYLCNICRPANVLLHLLSLLLSK